MHQQPQQLEQQQGHQQGSGPVGVGANAQGLGNLSNPDTATPVSPGKAQHGPGMEKHNSTESLANGAKPGGYHEASEAEASRLGLTKDEKLMVVPETGRRYVYNKVTKTSRWLPDNSTNESSASNPYAARPPAKPSAGAIPISRPDSANTTTPNNAGIDGGEKNGTAETPSSLPTDDAGAADGSVTSKLRTLNQVAENVELTTSSGKYDMQVLRQLVDQQKALSDTQDLKQRLLELAEYLTQQMLKVDAVESDGNSVVRTKRKETVNKILKLTDEVETLRNRVDR